jgi:hypothetical protein
LNVTRIFSVDICRDGGSYSLCFYSSDNEWYEFFVPIKWDGDRTIGYDLPRIYRRSVNDGYCIRCFTWGEAEQFVLPLRFDSPRFDQLVAIILRCGHLPDP